MADTVEDLKLLLENYKKKIKKDSFIDITVLDEESLRTPQLNAEYNGLLADEALKLKDIYTMRDKVYKKRWNYYIGKASDEEYTREPLHITVVKSDVDKYLKADAIMIEINKRLEYQKQIVKVLEEAVKSICARQFSIRDCLEYIKFNAGIV